MNMVSHDWTKDDIGTIWWQEVAGPHKYVKEFAKAVIDRKCLVTNADIQDDVFLKTLKDRISNLDCSLPYAYISVDDFDDIDAFTEYIVSKYAHGFRYDPLDDSPLKTLVDTQWLNNCIFLVDLKKTSCTWLRKVVTEVSSTSDCDKCAWIFRVPSKVLLKWGKIAKVQMLDMRHYIYYYDIQYFAMNCLQNVELSLQQQYYTADVIAKIANKDGRLCAAMACRDMYFHPNDVVSELQVSVDEAALSRILLETQMQHVLPIIESIRRYLIEKYDLAIQKILPEKDDYGKELNVPIELELRHLHYHSKKQEIIFREEDYRWLDIAHTARNEISHLKLLSTEQLDKLFTFGT